MIASLLILTLAIIIEIIYKPRLDITSEGELLLWYGRKYRKYKILF